MFRQHSLWLHMRLREAFVVTDPSSLPRDQSRRKRRGQSNGHPHGREKHLSSPQSLGDRRWGGEIPLWKIVDHQILSSHLPYRGGTPKSESCPERRRATDILVIGFSFLFFLQDAKCSSLTHAHNGHRFMGISLCGRHDGFGVELHQRRYQMLNSSVETNTRLR